MCDDILSGLTEKEQENLATMLAKQVLIEIIVKMSNKDFKRCQKEIESLLKKNPHL
jgi:hypothetical protein